MCEVGPRKEQIQIEARAVETCETTFRVTAEIDDLRNQKGAPIRKSRIFTGTADLGLKSCGVKYAEKAKVKLL
jgi:hypothetical protein